MAVSIETLEVDGKELPVFERVPYGRDDTPEENREYRIGFGGPVGTKAEIAAWLRAERPDIEGFVLEDDGGPFGDDELKVVLF